MFHSLMVYSARGVNERYKPEYTESMERRDFSGSMTPLAAGFRRACLDQLYLAERGYPVKQTVKLIGDRYQLRAVQRSILMRGVIPPGSASRRRVKLLSPEDLSGAELWVDASNVVVAVGNYLCGKFLYIATDGLLRDAAESRGVFRNDGIRKRAAELVDAALSELAPGKLILYIDAPLTHSRDLARELRAGLSRRRGETQVLLADHADEVLKQAPDIASSGDSEIIDSVDRVFDLTRFTLEKGLNARFPDLAEFIGDSDKLETARN
ncbi:hypothetical protein B4O97_01480 [Marispirochaeta aestuarii]|uniref:DUF434 domain-containing protein n=2 Tax=Marispirochaeta aestuarii TaxID=1963862 RepID=A0A1Y1S4J9_9SPIO|nr:hypothetical protein B4O97_01480 [Marispirochaeta aestuarii]